MFKRQTSGSVVCASCGSLVGVRDDKCLNCGRRNPGLWGFAPLLRSLGNDLGFVTLVMWGSGAMYLLSLLLSGQNLGMGGGSLLNILSPSSQSVFLLGASGALPVFGYGRGGRFSVQDGCTAACFNNLQHDVGSRSRFPWSLMCSARQHGDHLHRSARADFCSARLRRSIFLRCPCCAARS